MTGQMNSIAEVHRPPSPPLAPWASLAAVAAPAVIAAASIAVFWAPSLRPLRRALLGEFGPIELTTFFTLLGAGVASLAVAWSNRARHGDALVTVFFVLLGAGLALTAMEEIAWGQWFLRFSTPEAFRDNSQGELTLHNLPVMNGRNGFLRLAFGIAGMIGVAFGNVGRLRAIAVPPVLLAWFVPIAALAALSLWISTGALGPRFVQVFDDLDEVVEMMIGLAAVLYVWLHRRATRA